jgi:hypothetical protein
MVLQEFQALVASLVFPAGLGSAELMALTVQPALQASADFLESVVLVDLVAVLDLVELMEQQEHLGLVATLV